MEKVMKDNDSNVQLLMDGYLSSDELKVNLPSNVDSSNVDSTGGMRMYLFYSHHKMSESYDKYRDSFVKKAGSYCYVIFNGSDDEYRKYTWKTSIVKPTIENKMEDEGLTKGKELVGMSFSDGVETINSYVRIPLYEEIIIAGSGIDGSAYLANSISSFSINKSYWNLDMFHYIAFIENGRLFYNMGELTNAILPVITVNEK